MTIALHKVGIHSLFTGNVQYREGAEWKVQRGKERAQADMELPILWLCWVTLGRVKPGSVSPISRFDQDF